MLQAFQFPEIVIHPVSETAVKRVKRAGRRMQQLQSTMPELQPMVVTPIYAALPQEQQMRAFEPAPEGTRKVCLEM